MRSNKKRPTDNKIGNKQNQENRLQALSMLDEITAKREKEGYLWVSRGTTKKQIHPDKLPLHLEDGWKLKK